MSETNPNLIDKPTENDILTQIASEMAYNYFTCSFGKKPNREEDKAFERKQAEYVFSNEFMEKTFDERKFERCRNILIIGAGATYDSFKAIPKGDETIKLIDEYFELGILKNASTKKRLNQEFSGSRMKTGDSNEKNDEKNINNFDFENFLSFISRIVPEEDLREQIQKHFIHRCPTLFYEIVAHLFKHSFIDVIINFNFDELLDQAIEDELGKDYFRSIILDGECPEVADIVVDGRLKVPIYIKPHGTAKHKSLLRFTKDHYLQLPEKIKSLIAELVSGSVGAESNQNDKNDVNDGSEISKKINRVNLICVGFHMQSIEFNEILEKNLPEDSKIFHFSRSALPLSGNEFIDEKYAKNGIFTKGKITNNRVNSPLGEEFRNLWKIIKEQFKSISPIDDSKLAYDEVPKYIEPRGIARHEIINYLFYNTEKSSDKKYLDYFKEVDYFKDRIIIEIAIALVRNNGVVEIQELLNERLGYFYEQYKQKIDKLERIGDTNPRTFIDFCRIFELTNTYSFSKNLLNLPEQSFYDEEYLEEKIKNYKKLGKDNDLENWINIFGRFWQDNKTNINPKDKINIVVFNVIFLVLSSDKLSREFKVNFVRISRLRITDRRNSLPMFDNLLRLFHKMNSSSYYDIFPNYYDKKHLIFESINKNKILNTDLSVKFNYNTIVTNSDKWDALLIISDSGNPLKLLNKKNVLVDFDKKIKKKIILICCYHSMKIKYFKEIEIIKNELKLDTHSSIDNHLIFKCFMQKYQQKVTDDFEKEGLNIDLEILTLPYWHHNHHMAFFLKNSKHNEESIFPFSEDKKIENKQWEFMGAIYFYKKGFTNSINPIFIGKLQNELTIEEEYYYNNSIRNDSEKILSIFFSYKSAAEKYMEKEMKEMDVINDTENIIQQELKILNEFWKKNNL